MGKQHPGTEWISWDESIKWKGWGGLEAKLPFQFLVLVSVRLRGVVATVSATTRPLQWLASTVCTRSQEFLSVQFVIENDRQIGRSPLPPDCLGRDWYFMCRKQRELGLKKKGKRRWRKVSWVQLWQLSIWWMRELDFSPFFFFLCRKSGIRNGPQQSM